MESSLPLRILPQYSGSNGNSVCPTWREPCQGSGKNRGGTVRRGPPQGSESTGHSACSASLCKGSGSNDGGLVSATSAPSTVKELRQGRGMVRRNPPQGLDSHSTCLTRGYGVGMVGRSLPPPRMKELCQGSSQNGVGNLTGHSACTTWLYGMKSVGMVSRGPPQGSEDSVCPTMKKVQGSKCNDHRVRTSLSRGCSGASADYSTFPRSEPCYSMCPTRSEACRGEAAISRDLPRDPGRKCESGCPTTKLGTSQELSNDGGRGGNEEADISRECPRNPTGRGKSAGFPIILETSELSNDRGGGKKPLVAATGKNNHDNASTDHDLETDEGADILKHEPSSCSVASVETELNCSDTSDSSGMESSSESDSRDQDSDGMDSNYDSDFASYGRYREARKRRTGEDNRPTAKKRRESKAGGGRGESRRKRGRISRVGEVGISRRQRLCLARLVRFQRQKKKQSWRRKQKKRRFVGAAVVGGRFHMAPIPRAVKRPTPASRGVR